MSFANSRFQLNNCPNPTPRSSGIDCRNQPHNDPVSQMLRISFFDCRGRKLALFFPVRPSRFYSVFQCHGFAKSLTCRLRIGE
jgi:hypothetical protein